MPSPYALLQGPSSHLATLSSVGLRGNLLYTTDTKEVYVGTGTGTGVPTGWTLISGGGGSASFADNEILSGSGTSWTFANPPNPPTSIHLYVQQYTGGPFVRLPYSAIASIIGASMTTVDSYTATALLADYRY
jgi:hypothetical protein